MIPKIRFRYSWVYDDHYKRQFDLDKKSKGSYPNYLEIQKYLKNIEKLWEKKEKSILFELSKISGLKWKEKEVICYIIGKGIPFSDPLTIPIYRKEPDYFIDVLIHELIHQLFIQGNNYELAKSSWDYIFKKYSKEDYVTKIHIPLHAIHTHIYLKFFNKKRLERDYDYIKFLKTYKSSWDIVKREGYTNIIQEFKHNLLKI